MFPDIAMVVALACVAIGVLGFVWNLSLAARNRWRGRRNSHNSTNAAGHSSSESEVGARAEDRRLYQRAIALVRENRIVDGAKILEELGLNREAAGVLERAGMVHESAAVYLRRKRYHRAAEVYARNRMWEQAGNSYLLAAESMHDRCGKSPKGRVRDESATVNGVDTRSDASIF